MGAVFYVHWHAALTTFKARGLAVDMRWVDELGGVGSEHPPPVHTAFSGMTCLGEPFCGHRQPVVVVVVATCRVS
jgi:hypothetical protein